MVVHKEIRELIEKYSFIDEVTFKLAKIHFHYKKDNKLKKKSVPYRASKKQLMYVIERIKEDINYEEWRKKEDERIKKEVAEDNKKNSAFAFSN